MTEPLNRQAQTVLNTKTFSDQANYFAAWRKVEQKVRDAAKPGDRVFEVHHRIEHAREKFFAAIVEGKQAVDIETELA